MRDKSGGSVRLLVVSARHTGLHPCYFALNIWGTGRNHEQEDRIIQSKTSKSENRARLYLAYKDHKKEPEKTRPIGFIHPERP